MSGSVMSYIQTKVLALEQVLYFCTGFAFFFAGLYIFAKKYKDCKEYVLEEMQENDKCSIDTSTFD